jgi:hypothetical protein
MTACLNVLGPHSVQISLTLHDCRNYHYSFCNNLEERSLHLLKAQNLLRYYTMVTKQLEVTQICISIHHSISVTTVITCFGE